MSRHERPSGQTSGTADRAARDLHPPVQVIHLGALAAQVSAERERHQAGHTAVPLRNAPDLRRAR
jgi:hypothetical protein